MAHLSQGACILSDNGRGALDRFSVSAHNLARTHPPSSVSSTCCLLVSVQDVSIRHSSRFKSEQRPLNSPLAGPTCSAEALPVERNGTRNAVPHLVPPRLPEELPRTFRTACP